MKLVFVINQLKRGGAAKMIKYVANIAVTEFDMVSIIDMYDETYVGNDLHPKIQVKGLGLGAVKRLKRQFLLISSLRQSLREEKPDYVCSFVGHVNVIARLATLGMRNVIFISAERGDPYSESFMWKIVTKWTYLKSDYCFFQLDRALAFFGEKVKSHSWVIPNPVVLNKVVEPYWGERNKTIVSAGRFAPEKCYDVLIKAFAIVKNVHPDYSLVIYGDGRLKKDYEKLIIALGIQDSVLLPGYISCVAETIRKDGIFVLSSLFEGIPNSLIEAMSVAIPCVATDCTPGGPSFLLKGGTRGVLVPVKNVQEMADAIIRLIENPNYSKEIGKKSYEIVKELAEPQIREMWINAFKRIKNDA